MNHLSSHFLFFLETILFTSVVLMHLTKKNFTVILLYTVQSLVVSGVLFYSSIQEASFLLFIVAAMTFIVKVGIAPYFFFKLIKLHRLQFSVSTYLNSPMTFIVIALLTAFTYSHYFRKLTILSPSNGDALLLSMSMIFIAIFLTVNRKGALSQMVGILSFENAIVSFAYITGLETNAGAEVGILFIIFIWIIIATVFASMIYTHFGTLNVSQMKNLKEE
ncbi:MAG TPA: hypothetical protein DD381_02745 [Lentisphaeria bacterium]|nr:MAG: hypothetical protein A2X47_03510 [Lentisphaerae bacterium GWF2_38_69]HBM15253.1 hypothetical protein [Lentisphaeria bacterium]